MDAFDRAVEGAAEKLVLLTIADFANDRGECYPSYKTMAARCSMTVSEIRTALRKLQLQGFVVVEKRLDKRGGQTNFYTVMLPSKNGRIES